MNQQEQITRVRVQYTKGHSLRFTGHLDLQRLWERLLRRSGLPVRYSQGYHPRARLNLASALPLGFVSDKELLDFWMNEPRSVDEIQARLADSAPPGLLIKAVDLVPLQEDSLQSQMHASCFKVSFYQAQDRDALIQKINDLLMQDKLIRTRRKKTYDLRPLILDLAATPQPGEDIQISMKLLAEPGATGRPDEVLDALGFDVSDYLVRRTELILVKS